jgi:uncharacterized protein
MEDPADYRITRVEQLRAIIGTPGKITPLKLLDALDEHAIEYIRRSPFLVLGTADADGNQDVSPKGDAPGFVAVENNTTIVIPDRKGNKLIFGLQNILANPHVGIIFMVPGTNETLRVNGVAELSADPAILRRLAARGTPATLAIRVTIKECFFHCAKAFIRSQLWSHAAWQPPHKISFGKMLADKMGGDESAAAKIEEAIAHDYKHNL